MLLIAAGSLAISLLVSPGPDPTQGEDRTPVVRRIAATAALAAQEYRVGVKDGKVIAQAEVEEAQLFLTEARRTAAGLPLELSKSTGDELDRILGMIRQTASPDSIDIRVRCLRDAQPETRRVARRNSPRCRPARGAELYQTNCAVPRRDRRETALRARRSIRNRPTSPTVTRSAIAPRSILSPGNHRRRRYCDARVRDSPLRR
jgi:hypothetical protein